MRRRGGRSKGDTVLGLIIAYRALEVKSCDRSAEKTGLAQALKTWLFSLLICKKQLQPVISNFAQAQQRKEDVGLVRASRIWRSDMFCPWIRDDRLEAHIMLLDRFSPRLASRLKFLTRTGRSWCVGPRGAYDGSGAKSKERRLARASSPQLERRPRQHFPEG